MVDMDGRICANCVTDSILKDWIIADGQRSPCELCEVETATVPLRDLMWRIDEVFKSNFCPGPGSAAPTTIAKMAGISEVLANTMFEELSELYAHLEARGKDSNYYDADGYVEEGPDRPADDSRWFAFQRTIQRDARFFNNDAQAWLDDLFTGLNEQRTWEGDSVIVDFAAGKPGSGFFRARYAPNDTKLLAILSDPVAQLGPPPDGVAAPGRMNAAGLSVFYGALEKETCISEIRAPVGSSVILGRFDPVRPIRLLDLDRLSRVAYKGSHFDPDYWGQRNRIYMLPALVRQIARPVMPGDEALGYLPTQFVADYLAQCLEREIDGILFRSTQTDAAGRNVVLFNRASRVEPLDPAIELSVHSGWDEPAEPDNSITLSIRQRTAPHQPAGHASWGDERATTLRLDLDSIEVREIRATQYDAPPRNYSLLR